MISDMLRGRPAIYATFSSYDEVAHHSGLERHDTLEALRKVDKLLGRIARAALHSPRPYEIVVLSDHGQTQGATFKQRNGYAFDELVRRSVESRSVQTLLGGDENDTTVGLALEEARDRGARRTKRQRAPSWASRVAGTPLPERVPGSDLVLTLPEAAAEAGLSVFLLGGNPGVADAAAARLQAMYPRLGEVGFYCPPFGFEDDPEELSRIRSTLRAARPDLVLVGLGFPKQERVIRALRPELPGAWFVGVGISLSFIAGDQPRAPVILQRVGLEWIHRLWHEPRRLFRRYVVHGIPFSTRLFGWALKRRLVGSRKASIRRVGAGRDERRLTCSSREPGPG